MMGKERDEEKGEGGMKVSKLARHFQSKTKKKRKEDTSDQLHQSVQTNDSSFSLSSYLTTSHHSLFGLETGN